MQSVNLLPVLKCKKCKDIFMAKKLASHCCFKSDSTSITTVKQKTINSIDRQCCVLEKDIPCTNSIICKLHTLEQKKEIKGRFYPVEILIKIIKKENLKKKEVESEVKENVDEQALLKAFKVIDEIKPVVHYQFDDQKFLRENSEMKNIFQSLNRKNGEINKQGFNQDKSTKKEYSTKKKQIKNATKTKESQIM